MAIRYRPPNGEWITIEGDRYELNAYDYFYGDGQYRAYFRCIIDYFAYRVNGVIYSSPGYIYAGFWQGFPGQIVIGDFINTFYNPDNPHTSRLYISFNFLNGTVGNSTPQASSAIPDNPPSASFLSGYRSVSRAILESSVVFSHVEKYINGEWVNISTLGSPWCLFTIYQNEEVAYSNVWASCPEVEIAPDNECPPGTCKVVCGNVTCCYNSQGIAIQSFTN